MSKGRIAAVVAILLGVAAFAWVAIFGIHNDPSELPSALIDKQFPAFELQQVDNSQVLITEKSMLGKPALVNVWATWCAACKDEHPVLNDLAKQGVVIHGVNYKDDNASAQKWLRDFHNPYQLNIFDPKGTLGFDLGVYGAPETFIVDKAGKIRYKLVGVVTKEVWRERLAPIYQELLDE
ncbi:DsbE family thiol:disulfide interchange protein [Thiopseudomonas alkaliphila]|uniref:Thiol:disulfide interchange protein n=1 Tax=Thiopseudomonas alkaliphila TaxID=1697053 RepID=A0A0K1XB91_9GAMM|nr:DsbE family thiol:disulfide interchange protein [Thiopseudomonas alkaliphila]AKX58581.1 thiol:disulfide interchange protein [Thiopseudomonas alkaliphila]MDM1715803.1 DsbE family thiol:disulfide interchange protein [Thiopseudomonas alkaliphila]